MADFSWPWFLMVFGLAVLSGLLWQLQLAHLLTHLAKRQPELYRNLGQPVMHVLWWSWPGLVRPNGPELRVGLLKQTIRLRNGYEPSQILALLKLMRLIVLHQPAWSLDQRTHHLLRQLRWIGLAEMGLLGVMGIGLLLSP